MSKTKSTVDEFKTAFLPFSRMLAAVEALEPILSKEQAEGELDKAIRTKTEELATITEAVETARMRQTELQADAGEEAQKVISEAKEKARNLVEAATRKVSAIENDSVRKIKELEDAAVELQARAESAKQEAFEASQATTEEQKKLDKIKATIAKLVEG